MNLGVPSKDTGWRMSDVAGDQNWRGTLKKEQMMASPTAQRRRLPRNTILAQETVRGPASAAAGASSTQAGVDGAAAASPEVPPAASPVPLPRWGGVVIRAPPQQQPPRSSRRGDLSARSSARGIAAAYLSARSGASQSQTSRSYATSRTGMTDATDFKHLSNHRRALEKRLEELDELIELQDGGLAEADAEMKGQRSMHARRQTEVTIEYK